MKKRALSVAACALLLLANEAEAQSVVISGEIHFQGAIVESSYEIAPASEMSTGKSIKLIEVEPGVVIAVNMASRGVSGSEPLFTTAFEVLKNVPSARDNGSASKRGVLTISYR